jgi:hypothetical protein
MDYKLILAIFGIIQYMGLQIYIGSKLGQDITSMNVTGYFQDISSLLGGSGYVTYSISGGIAVVSFIYLMFRLFKYVNRR